jgi:16S rRNA (uracil1498-N3)-methyltransferase
LYKKIKVITILIGPEGDFSEKEIIAIENDYQPLHWVNTRLRTETAAIVACIA